MDSDHLYMVPLFHAILQTIVLRCGSLGSLLNDSLLSLEQAFCNSHWIRCLIWMYFMSRLLSVLVLSMPCIFQAIPHIISDLWRQIISLAFGNWYLYKTWSVLEKNSFKMGLCFDVHNNSQFLSILYLVVLSLKELQRCPELHLALK